MGKFGDILMGAAGSAASGGIAGLAGAGMGMLFQGQQDRRQVEQQRKLQELQMAGNKQMMDYQNKLQLEMWEKTNYDAQKQQLKKAGLNPALMYGMSGGGGTTTGSGGMGMVSGGSAAGSAGEAMQGMGMGLQGAMMKAQIENIKADTAQKLEEAGATGGYRKDKAESETENNALQAVILKYMGKEAADQYEVINRPLRGVEQKTKEDEYGARQAIADTTYELWREGKLKEKAYEEIEGIMLQNAKSREERNRIIKDIELMEKKITGQELENMLNELELKLVTSTGLDKNSPIFLRVIGRLFSFVIDKYRK